MARRSTPSNATASCAARPAIRSPAADGSGAAGARRARRREGARAGAAVEDRLRRPQLQGSRGRERKALPAEPLLFIKPSTAVSAPATPIRLPPGVGRVDHEAELGVVIGRRAHRVPRGRRLGLRPRHDLRQRRDGARSAEEGVAVHALQGLRHVRADRPVHRDRARTASRAASKDGSTASAGRRRAPAHLIFPIEHLIEFITFVMTLEPGDIISTGTPEGVGPVKRGDTVTVKVEGVGELTNPVSRTSNPGVSMKLFIDTGNIKDIETLAALGIIDGVTTNPSLLAKEPGDYPREPEEDLRDRQGPGQRRGDGDRLRRHDARGARHREDRPAHDRQGAADARRHPGVQDAVGRRHPRQRHAVLLGGAGAARRQGRRDLRQPVRRPARRRRRPTAWS